jgi:predicted dehydrogenase
MSEKTSVNVAVVGAGGMANSVHLPSLRDMEDVNVVAVCDLISEKARKTAEKFDIPRWYTVYHEMLEKEELDAALVLVEPSNHFHVVWHCLNAGLDTFMEKPPGISLFQAESLKRKAEAEGKFLMVGFNRRHIPLVREVKKRFDELTYPTQVEGCFYKFGSAAFDKGSLTSFESDTIHAVDLVRWLGGGMPVDARTIEAQYEDEVVNAWNSVARFDNGVTALVKANYRVGGRVHRFELHGPGASAFINLGMGAAQCEAMLLTHGGGSQYSLAAGAASDSGNAIISGTELAGSDQFYRFYGFYFEDRHFIDCVRNRTEPETSIQDAVKSFQYVDMILKNKF